MIVVAIIAILASIAIPNFLRFQCKSKQSEVKAGLGSLFISEKTFLSEYNTYATDLVFVNWEPEGSPLYIYGFDGDSYPSSVPGLAGFDPTRNNTMNNGVIGNPVRYNTSKTKDLTGALLDTSDLSGLSMCSGQQFTISGAADINPDTSLQLDLWVMNQSRDLTATASDCKSN